MKFNNIVTIVIFLQKANIIIATNYGIPAGGDAEVICATADDQCCSNSTWWNITNSGAPTFDSTDCVNALSQGTYVGCTTDEYVNASTADCTVECSSGCSVEFRLVMSTTATTNQTTASTATDDASTDDSSTADGLTPIDGDFSTVEIITIAPNCASNVMTTFPRAMFTIKPSTVAYVSSYPANLVTPIVSGNLLNIEWNDAVAKGAKSGGVIIGLPPDQFAELSLSKALTAQILSGFTSVKKLHVNGASTLKATLTSSSTSDFFLHVDDASTVNVVSYVGGTVGLYGASTVKVQAPLLSSILSTSASRLEVDGNVFDGDVGGASTVLVTGDISGSLSINGASTIKANTISGSIDNSGASTVNAASCDNVQSNMASSCNVRGPPTVNVDVSQLGAISTNVCQCNESYFSCSSDGSSLGSSTSLAVAAVTGATTLFAFLVM
ncbi:hypothetical protein ACHAXM_004217 [Skeletonema potamos]|jgi:hypothetical protein